MIKERSIFRQIMPYIDSPEAIVITGMRRTGKTTTLQYLYERIVSKNKLYLDLENPVNRRYFEEENYERVKLSFEVMGIDFTGRPYIFLDEIQFVKNLPSVIKYFIDHYKAKFFVTGSASFYLKNLFTESLSGRKFIFEIYPLSFREFLIFKDSPLKIPENTADLTRALYETFAYLYEEYFLFGGFPGVVLKSNVEEKKKVLDEIFSSFFQLEIAQLGDFRRNDVIRNLMLLLMQRIGSKLNIQKISRELGVSRPTLNQYVSFLEGTYWFKLVRPFSRARNSEIRKVPKVYVCDSGLANQYAKIDKGLLFENSIFQNLRLQGELNYYQRKGGRELDFVLNKSSAFEVKLTPQARDLRNLKELASALKLKEFALISENYSNLENTIYGFTL